MAAKKSEKKAVAATATSVALVDGSSAPGKTQPPARKAKKVAAVAPEVLAPAAPVAPAFDEIRERAYAIHLGGGGSSLDNWLQAERELRSERGLGE